MVKILVRWLQVSNEDKVNKYYKKKILKYIIIVLSLATITSEAFALFQMISFLWGLGTFAILYIVKYFYIGSDKDKNTKKKVKNKKDNQKKKWLSF